MNTGLNLFKFDRVKRSKHFCNLLDENRSLKEKIRELENEIEKIKVKEQKNLSDNPEYRTNIKEKSQ